jgi:hypothetical protein
LWIAKRASDRGQGYGGRAHGPLGGIAAQQVCDQAPNVRMWRSARSVIDHKSTK